MYLYIDIYISAGPSACGLSNSNRFDSKSEVTKRRAATQLTEPASSAWADLGSWGSRGVAGGPPGPPIRRMERPPYHVGDIQK